jgi:hypothetical protein
VDLSGMSWAVSEVGMPGYKAFLGPASACFTAFWLGLILTKIHDSVSSAPDWVGVVGDWLLAAGIFLIFLSFWLWLFMRPRFLVPPHLRGQPGWVAGSWQQRRERRRRGRALKKKRPGPPTHAKRQVETPASTTHPGVGRP